jgi:UPF0716 family protein affecting phage T7 exclusion
MTNSLELLKLADSLDRQGFYKLAQEAEESAQEQAASQQELQENTSNFYGMVGNVAEIYNAYNFLVQLKNLIAKSGLVQQLISSGRIRTIDNLIARYASLGDGYAVKLLQSMAKNKILAPRMQNLQNYFKSFDPGTFFTPQELNILTKERAFTQGVLNSQGFLSGRNVFPRLGLTSEIVNANPEKFRNVLRLIGSGNIDEATNILRSIKGVSTDQIMAFRQNAPSIMKTIQQEANVLVFDKATTAKGSEVFKALKAMASEIPVLGKVVQILEVGLSKGLPIMGALSGAVEIFTYYKQWKTAPEEDKGEATSNMAHGVANLIGNVLMLIPGLQPYGTALLALNFASEFVSKGLENYAYGEEGFANKEQMLKTKQIAEQDLSVVSSNPEVTKAMDYLIKKNWVYFESPARYKNEISQKLMPNNALADIGGLYGSDRNANFWKWSGNTNSPEYLEFVQSLTQLKKKLFDSFRQPRQMTQRTSCRVKIKLKYA